MKLEWQNLKKWEKSKICVESGSGITTSLSCADPIIAITISTGIQGTVVSLSLPQNGTIESVVVVKGWKLFMRGGALRWSSAQKGDGGEEEEQKLHPVCQLRYSLPYLSGLLLYL